MSTTETSNANRTRWGGFLLLLSIVLTAGGALLQHMTYPTGLPADDAEAAASITANAALYGTAGWVRLAASALGAVAAFFLVTRTVNSGFPGSAFWISVGLGHLMLAGLFAFRTSGFMVLAENQATLPVAFEAARASLVLLGTMGGFLVYAGLLGAFWAEARSTGAAVPGALSTLLALCAGIGVASQTLNLWPVTGQAAALLGYVIYPTALLLVPFALKVAWPQMAFVWTRTTGTRAGT